MGLNRIRDALLEVSENVWHHRALKRTPPYIIWEEDGQADTLWADGRLQQMAVTGSVHLFTREEKDPLVQRVPEAFGRNGISFRLNSVQYEEDTKLLHYEWIWEAADGEDFF